MPDQKENTGNLRQGIATATRAFVDALRRGKAQCFTVIILLLPAGWYGLSYVPQQSNYLSERNFRQLNVVSYALESKIDSSIRTLKTLASAAHWHSPDSPSNWIATTIRLSPGLELERAAIKATTNKTSRPAVQVKYMPEQGVAFECEAVVECSTNWQLQIAAKRRFENLLAEREEFNVMLLADCEGKVICQQSAPGWTALDLKQLPSDAGHPLKTNVERAVSFVADARCAGTAYKVFAQPIRVPGTNDQVLATFWLVGMVESKLFLLETLAISHRALAHLGLLTLGVFAIMPFFKLQFMGPHISLRPRDAAALGAAAVILTGLLSFCLLDFCAHHHRKKSFNDDLRVLGTQISSNLIADIRDSHWGLQRLTMVATQGVHFPENVISNDAQRVHYMTNALEDPVVACELTQAKYPWFDMVSWLDANGFQNRKWTAKSTPTPFINLRWRTYFTDAQAQRRSLYEYRDKTNHCWVEPVVSANTGESTVAVAMPHGDGVAVMDGKFISVIRPLLPPNCGFAIVSPDGLVLLHSDPARNMRENINQECNYHPRLRAALLGGRGEPFDISYQGRPHAFYLTAVPGLAWSVIVFREASLVNRASFDVLWASLIFFAIYLLLLCLCWWKFQFPLPQRTAWIWPGQGKPRAYCGVIAVGLLIVAFFGVCTAFSKQLGIAPLVLASFSLLSPLLGGLAYRRCMKGKTWCDLQGNRGSSTGFAATVASLLLLFGAIPAFGLFKLAHDIQMVSMIKQTQLQLVKRLTERAARVENDYGQIFRLPRSRQEWLDKRLHINPDEPRDLYIGAMFLTKLEHPDKVPFPATPAVCSKISQAFEAFVAYLQPMHHRTAGRKAEVFREDTVDRKWAWKRESRTGAAGIYEVLRLSDQRDAEFPQLASIIPAFHFVWWTPLLPLALFCLVYGIARFLAQHLFAGEAKPARVKPGEAPALLPHRLVLVPTGKDCSHPWAKTKDPAFTHLDIRDEPQWEPWRAAALGRAISGPATKIVIHNLEFKYDEPPINVKKLELLEKLVADGRFAVMVLSSVHPEHFRFIPPNADEAALTTAADLRARWLCVFDTFASEYGKEATVPGMVIEPADCQGIWASCSRDEQLALYQLARHGLINSRNSALPLLLARGLVVSTPKLEVQAGNLAAYVCKAFCPDDLRANEAEEMASGWKVMKKVIWIVICAALLFLFLTQREQFTATVGLMTAFTTAVPALLKFFGVFKSENA